MTESTVWDSGSIISHDRELRRMDRCFDKGFEVVERLLDLSASISQYGLSRSTMEAVDPKGELVLAGCFPAYESLSEITEGDVATESLDRIKQMIKDLWEKLLSVLRSIGNTIRKWFRAVINFFRPAKKQLSTMRKEVHRHNTSSTEKFGPNDKIPDDVLVRALTLDLFNKTYRVATQVLDSFEGDANLKDPLAVNEDAFQHRSKVLVAKVLKVATDDIREVLGVGLDVDKATGKWTMRTYGDGIIVSEGRFAELGWSSLSVEQAMGKAEDALNAADSLDRQIGQLAKRYDELVKYIKEELRYAPKKQVEELQGSHRAIHRLRAVLQFIQTLIQRSVKGINKLTLSSLNLGRVVLMTSRRNGTL